MSKEPEQPDKLDGLVAIALAIVAILLAFYILGALFQLYL